MTINKDTIKVKFKIIEEKKLKAIGTLDFGDFVVKGFRIMDSNFPNSHGDNLWLTPPSYRSGGGNYHPIFFMPDKPLWEELQEHVWTEYYKQSDEHYKKRFDLDKKDDISL